MILREATRDDLQPLMALCKKAWTRLGIPFDTNIGRFRALLDQGVRIVVLYDNDQLIAALAGHRIETDRGPGYEVDLFVVNPDHDDKIRMLDALTLYACNLALSEGLSIILSYRANAIPGAHYGRDNIGMQTTDEGRETFQIGDADAIAKAILERRPEWRP